MVLGSAPMESPASSVSSPSSPKSGGSCGSLDALAWIADRYRSDILYPITAQESVYENGKQEGCLDQKERMEQDVWAWVPRVGVGRGMKSRKTPTQAERWN